MRLEGGMLDHGFLWFPEISLEVWAKLHELVHIINLTKLS